MRRTSTAGHLPARRPVPVPSRDLAGAIAATAELCGHPLSSAAIALLVRDLATLDRDAVLKALAHCRIDLRGALNIGEILVRFDDGRPSADEAWKMLPATEANSVVWTDEMAQSWAKVLPLLQKGEFGQAQRQFEECYVHAVLLARCRREKITWTPSLGSDPQERERVLQDALQKERLPASYVKELLPYRSLSTHSGHILEQIRLKKIP